MNKNINNTSATSANNTIVDGTFKKPVPKIIAGTTVTYKLDRLNPTHAPIINAVLKQMDETGLDYGFYYISLDMPKCFKMEDGGYQRKLDYNKIKKNCKEFNPDRVNPILVNYRDGEFWIIDGQHTWEMLKQMGYASGWAKIMINRELSYEFELFYKQDEGKTKVSTWDKFCARIGAKEPNATIIKMVCDKHDIIIAPRNTAFSQPMHIYSIRKLDEIVKRGGEDALEFTIQTIIELGWHKYDNGFTENILQISTAYKYCAGNKANYAKLMSTLRGFEGGPVEFIAEANRIYASPESRHPENPARKYIEAIFA